MATPMAEAAAPLLGRLAMEGLTTGLAWGVIRFTSGAAAAAAELACARPRRPCCDHWLLCGRANGFSRECGLTPAHVCMCDLHGFGAGAV